MWQSEYRENSVLGLEPAITPAELRDWLQTENRDRTRRGPPHRSLGHPLKTALGESVGEIKLCPLPAVPSELQPEPEGEGEIRGQWGSPLPGPRAGWRRRADGRKYNGQFALPVL